MTNRSADIHADRLRVPPRTSAINHSRRAAVAAWWWEHGLALVLYLVLAIALSWPTLAHFTTAVTGAGHDALHNVWLLWHTKEAFLGHQPLFDAPYLYYPQGASLLTHGLGPVMGVFGLPFWFWGPEAAHNGALLVAMTLNGYLMYRLARGLGLDRSVALVGGLMLLVAPMALAGLSGHMTKVFLGGTALVLLAGHHALDPQRSRWWCAATAGAMLLVLLHSGYQFVFAGIALGLVWFAAWWGRERPYRILAWRTAWLALSGALIVGPLLVAVVHAGSAPGILTDLSDSSRHYQPDLTQFVMPTYTSRLWGQFARDTAMSVGYYYGPEQAITLSLPGIALCLVAALNVRRSWRWLFVLLVLMILALGPSLKVLGQRPFGENNMPYVWLMQLPGIGFVRTPGRFMMVGYVVFVVVACLGLNWTTKRWPRGHIPILVVVVSLVLVESWRVPASSLVLPQAPRFYQEIASDDASYGVFDLPANAQPDLDPLVSTPYAAPSAVYQIYQMTHGKGIAAGYLSRTYNPHPLFPYLMRTWPETGQQNLLRDGQPADYANAQADLARYNYRYVVWHKSGAAEPTDADEAAQQFIALVFPDQPPLIDDNDVQVYRVPEQAIGLPRLRYGANWRPSEGDWRWAASPATLDVVMPNAGAVVLEMTPAAIHDPQTANGLGEQGTLRVSLDGTLIATLPVAVDLPASLPLTLPPGEHTLALELEAGNFVPSTYGGSDDDELSFAIRSINLATP